MDQWCVVWGRGGGFWISSVGGRTQTANPIGDKIHIHQNTPPPPRAATPTDSERHTRYLRFDHSSSFRLSLHLFVSLMLTHTLFFYMLAHQPDPTIHCLQDLTKVKLKGCMLVTTGRFINTNLGPALCPSDFILVITN